MPTFYSTRKLATVALIAMLALASAGSGAGLPFLLELQGIATLIHYVPGGLDRAAHVQLRFELLIDDFRQWTKFRSRQNLFVIDREGWEALGTDVPYGVPLPIGDGVALAAIGDEGTVSLWRGLVGDALPTSATGAGMALRSEPAEVGSLALHDLMAEIEVARRLTELSDLRGEAAWIDELIAHVVARTAFRRHESARMPEIDLVFARLTALRPGLVPLAGGESSPPLALEDRFAYQGRYLAGARVIVEKDGLASVIKLRKLTRKGKVALTEVALLERYPGLAEWLSGSFQR